MKAVYVVNGPNLNLLGAREPDIYGRATLADVEARLEAACRGRGVALTFRQSNHEGDLIDWIQEAGKAGAPVILNAGAFTHTSIALYDAIRGSGATCIEVHLSNTQAREPFRRRSYISPAARGVVMGFGPLSYDLALQALFAMADQQGLEA
jgi:3-dehydroquinate dehydratase-2